ncbi:MAG: hypothetical protein NWF07_09660 [Candidatus Bathyarchaeota archaeon]|nr:hypothetical protein [Candidatus Bathyarchaeota archaeon]
MTDKINLQDMEKKAHKLLNEDGMMELLMGVILFVSSTSFTGTASFTPFLGVYVIFMRTIIEAYRKRITYPRIGYLKLPDEAAKDVGIGILMFIGVIMLALIVFISLIYGQVTGGLLFKWIPALIGLILFGGLYYNYERTGDRVNLVYIIISLLSGIVFSVIEHDNVKAGVVYHLLFLSGIFIVAGVVRLYNFTRRYPVISVDERGSDNE